MISKDAILHVFLGLAYALIVAVTLLIPWPLNIFMVAAEMIFFREVSQKQEDIDDEVCKICTGWDFWNWSEQKKLETWFPMVALIVIGSALLFV